VLARVGFSSVRVTDRYDCFRATAKESVARKFGVIGVNVYARKPS